MRNDDFEYINLGALKSDIRIHKPESMMEVIQEINRQPVSDVIPVKFIKEYINKQETGTAYQWALLSLLGAWILEKEKQKE